MAGSLFLIWLGFSSLLPIAYRLLPIRAKLLGMRKTYSTREVAPKLRIHHVTLSRYVASGMLSVPKVFTAGNMTIHAWTEDDIETARKLLPKVRKLPYRPRKKQLKTKKKK